MTKKQLLKELEKFSDDAEIVYNKPDYDSYWGTSYEMLELDGLSPAYKDRRRVTKDTDYDEYLEKAEYIFMEFC